nr:immunoglobulin light chain junction region [Macaca mulatta]MOX51547.1 immunoglobulin light chain junction region [Macaca mulatta]MOX51806.1 immunoglobulin light chain junction region [Macaca mulatta]MOX51813.1 immunoglobulin light chain junction region [Macaca mulatta]MOX51968.1 immunoglobulin light chain junction region [Macaca mulatta]
CQQFNDMLFTF